MTVCIITNSKITLTFKDGEEFSYECHPQQKPTLHAEVVTIPVGEDKYKEIWSSSLHSIDVIDEVERND